MSVRPRTRAAQLNRGALDGAAQRLSRLSHQRSRRTRFLLSTLVLLASCVISRPEVVEPKWNDAPPPRTAAITEITWELRTCVKSCRYEHIVLRRGGRASHEFRTGKRVDSLFLASVDSSAFLALGSLLLERGFFIGRDEEGEHEPLATKSLVMSVATLCRRRARSVWGLARLPRPWLRR